MIKQIATPFALSCMLAFAPGCGGNAHDSSTSGGAISDDAGAAPTETFPNMVGTGGSDSGGGGSNAGASGSGSGNTGSGNAGGAFNPGGSGAPATDLSCLNCNGLCFFGTCLDTGPAMTPAGTGGSGGTQPGQPGTACQRAADCDSKVCYFFTCAAPSCGDGVCNGDENAKTCAGDCPDRCGDGVTTGSEKCDDGNVKTERCAYGKTKCTVCDAKCNKVAGATSYCGDGVLAADDGETCEDGNAVAGDGCDASCQVEPVATCGNGAIDGAEQCDDGNSANFDGCNGACRIEQGWTCPAGPGACHETCGDKLVVGMEACDDGNSEDADYCSNDCKTVRSCGDSKIQSAAGESCDDGNTVTETCAYGEMTCTACDSHCKIVPARYCGNGTKTDNEDCDDGNTVTEACSYGVMSCSVCDASCRMVQGATSFCGDGRRDDMNAEQCDDGNTVTETCTYGDRGCSVCNANCQLLDSARYCGDGRTTNDEQCDDGNTVTEPCAYGLMSCSVCNANCQSVAGATSYCGDAVIDMNNAETCDDGNTTGSDGCSATCTTETM